MRSLRPAASIRALRAAEEAARLSAPPTLTPAEEAAPPAGRERPTRERPAYPEPELVPPEAVVRVERERDPPLSPVGRAAIGAAIGGLVTAAFELPGGPVTGILAGGVLGYYLPTGKGRRRG